MRLCFSCSKSAESALLVMLMLVPGWALIGVNWNLTCILESETKVGGVEGGGGGGGGGGGAFLSVGALSLVHAHSTSTF